MRPVERSSNSAWHRTSDGCCSRASARASRRTRSASAGRTESSHNSLSAHGTPGRSASHAFHTSACPPSPSGSISVNRSTDWPGWSATVRGYRGTAAPRGAATSPPCLRSAVTTSTSPRRRAFRDRGFRAAPANPWLAGCLCRGGRGMARRARAQRARGSGNGDWQQAFAGDDGDDDEDDGSTTSSPESLPEDVLPFEGATTKTVLQVAEELAKAHVQDESGDHRHLPRAWCQ